METTPLISGAPPRLARRLVPTIFVVNPGRHFLPSQAGTEPRCVVRIDQDAEIDARKARQRRRERLSERHQAQDGIGLLNTGRQSG